MHIAQTRLSIATAPREIKEITAEVARWTERQRISVGLLTLYIPHTSAPQSVADGVKSPSQRPGLLAWQSGKGGLVECFPPSTTPKYCYLPEGVSLPRLIFIE